MCLYRPGWASLSCLSFSFWGKIHFFLPPKKKSVWSCSNTYLGIFENDFISFEHERNTTRFSLFLVSEERKSGVSGVENINSTLRRFDGLCTLFVLSLSSFWSYHCGGRFVSLLLMTWIDSIFTCFIVCIVERIKELKDCGYVLTLSMYYLCCSWCLHRIQCFLVQDDKIWMVTFVFVSFETLWETSIFKRLNDWLNVICLDVNYIFSLCCVWIWLSMCSFVCVCSRW